MLFSTDMVRSLDKNIKTETRRLRGLDKINESPNDWFLREADWPHISKKHKRYRTNYIFTNSGLSTEEKWVYHEVLCPYGEVGDVIWVRERFVQSIVYDEFGNIQRDELGETLKTFLYYATEGQTEIDWIDEDGNNGAPIPWKPNMHMPKAACRLFLEITSIRVERLHDISEADAMCEGVEKHHHGWKKYTPHNPSGFGVTGVCMTTAYASFETLWTSISGPESWEANPYVWVIKFKKVEKPVDFV